MYLISLTPTHTHTHIHTHTYTHTHTHTHAAIPEDAISEPEPAEDNPDDRISRKSTSAPCSDARQDTNLGMQTWEGLTSNNDAMPPQSNPWCYANTFNNSCPLNINYKRVGWWEVGR